ncbi:MAG: TIGR04086 family membrane protein [Clostridia bacterium]|nr:TIGR04086 family membrane protein [Clostridia bacterium]
MKQVAQDLKTTINEKLNLMTIVKGIIVSYIITIPLFIVFSLLLTYTDFPEKFIPAAVIVTTVISILTAGSTATKNVRNRGWLNGSIVGLIYMAVLYLISSITFRDFGITRYVITMLVIGILAGAIGGIIGINMKNGSKSKHKR